MKSTIDLNMKQLLHDVYNDFCSDNLDDDNGITEQLVAQMLGLV